MKRAVLLLLVLLPLGCAQPNRAFVAAMTKAWNVIGAEYRTYVQLDPNLSAEDRATRLRTAELLSSTLLQASR